MADIISDWIPPPPQDLVDEAKEMMHDSSRDCARFHHPPSRQIMDATSVSCLIVLKSKRKQIQELICGELCKRTLTKRNHFFFFLETLIIFNWWTKISSHLAGETGTRDHHFWLYVAIPNKHQFHNSPVLSVRLLICKNLTVSAISFQQTTCE